RPGRVPGLVAPLVVAAAPQCDREGQQARQDPGRQGSSRIQTGDQWTVETTLEAEGRELCAATRPRPNLDLIRRQREQAVLGEVGLGGCGVSAGRVADRDGIAQRRGLLLPVAVVAGVSRKR